MVLLSSAPPTASWAITRLLSGADETTELSPSSVPSTLSNIIGLCWYIRAVTRASKGEPQSYRTRVSKLRSPVPDNERYCKSWIRSKTTKYIGCYLGFHAMLSLARGGSISLLTCNVPSAICRACPKACLLNARSNIGYLCVGGTIELPVVKNSAWTRWGMLIGE